MVSVLGTEMEHLNKHKKNNAKVTAATLYTLTATATTIILVAGIAATAPLLLQLAYAPTCTRCGFAPVVVSGDNVYIAWWTNNTENGNEEVMFRASNDGGETFGDKINLSNTTDADSWRVEIAGEGDTVVVSWWETANQTSDIPVARISTDAGETFGELIMLGTNGTIASTEEGEEGETVEEVVGGADVAE
jgi:hypothetical protein